MATLPRTPDDPRTLRSIPLDDGRKYELRCESCGKVVWNDLDDAMLNGPFSPPGAPTHCRPCKCWNPADQEPTDQPQSKWDDDAFQRAVDRGDFKESTQALQRVMDRHAHDAMAKQAHHIEMLCAAYYKATGIAPTECVLVKKQTVDGFRWWFEKRTDEDRVSDTRPDYTVDDDNLQPMDDT